MTSSTPTPRTESLRMGEMKHTAGPWHVDGPVEEALGGEQSLFICAPKSMMVLADLNPVHIDTPANARLMAAAPDLFDFAQAFVAYVARSDTDDLDFGRGLAASGLVEQAQAALAKATQ